MWVAPLANVADASHVVGMTMTTQQVLQGVLEAPGKGGFWLRGHGHVTTARARRMTGIAAEPRIRRPRIAYGDDAQLIAFVNRKGR